MKKLYLFAVALVMSVSAMAQKVAYILPNGCTYSNGELSGFPSEEFEGQSVTQELNAATWFKRNYVDNGKGAFVTITEASNGELMKYNCTWIHLERFNDKWKAANELGFSDIKEALRKYVINGGNLVLSTQATWIAFDMGRVGYDPNVSQNATYEIKSNANDYWGTLANFPINHEVNNNEHPLFNGLGRYADDNDFWHGSVQLLNSYYRHNFDPRFMFNDYSWLNGDKTGLEEWTRGNIKERLDNFEKGWNCKVLSQRYDIGDYCLPEIVEFLPCTEAMYTTHKDWFSATQWRGTVLCIGANFYQWMESTDNTNIAKMTTNAFDYLCERNNPVSILSVGYATCFDTKAYTMPEGVEGYVAYMDGNNFNFKQEYNAGNVVPANTPLVLKGEGNYILIHTDAAGTAPEHNGLKGAATDMTAAEMIAANEGNNNFYALSLNAEHNPESVGFYWVNDGGAAFDIPAGKAYFVAPKSSNAARGFSFAGDLTGIDNVNSNAVKTQAFNINGQHVAANHKGIVIVNGKKMYNK